MLRTGKRLMSGLRGECAHEDLHKTQYWLQVQMRSVNSVMALLPMDLSSLCTVLGEPLCARQQLNEHSLLHKGLNVHQLVSARTLYGMQAITFQRDIEQWLPSSGHMERLKQLDESG